jgi:hypothetical protein
MYVSRSVGLLPKFVTWTSEAAFAGGAPTMIMTAVKNPAAVSVATPAANSARSLLLMFCPFLGPSCSGQIK